LCAIAIFFPGYAALKWRRLIRMLIIIPTFAGLIIGFIKAPIEAIDYLPEYVKNQKVDILKYYCHPTPCLNGFRNNNRYNKKIYN